MANNNSMFSSDFGVYHLANNVMSYEPVRTNNFRFYAGFDSDMVTQDLEHTIDFATGTEIIDFSVVSFTPPSFSQKPISINRGNSSLNFAGKASWQSSLPLKVRDYYGASGKSVLEAWQALSYQVINDIIPRAANYKKDCVVMEYLPDNTLIRYWELKGCWVSDFKEDGWSNDSSNQKTATATITYDWAIPHTVSANEEQILTSGNN